MYSIKNDIIYEINVKNSRFIAYIFNIKNKIEFDNKLNNIKNKYKDASHYCYAYILDDYKKSSDDGEPGGTAGLPIMNVLINNKLINIGCIVVRYFGGIKLGTGGLVRAYSKSVKEALKNVELVNIIKGINVDIYFEYNKVNDIDYILKDYSIIDKEYNEYIKYNVNITYEVLSLLKEYISKYEIINNNVYF